MASTEPSIGTPPPSPLSYKTPHMSKITPFTRLTHSGHWSAMMAAREALLRMRRIEHSGKLRFI